MIEKSLLPEFYSENTGEIQVVYICAYEGMRLLHLSGCISNLCTPKTTDVICITTGFILK